MTLPDERRRALESAGETLRDMAVPRRDMELWGGPVPEKLRAVARLILRHYPEPWQIRMATQMDDVKVSEWISKDFKPPRSPGED